MSLSSASTSAFSTSSASRFHGVLATSKNRVLKNQLFNFLSYLYFISPPNRYFLIFIEIWRFIQWLFLCLVPGNRLLYPLGSARRRFVGILGIFNRVVPYGFLKNENCSYYVIFCSVYLSLFVLFFILFFVSMYFFSINQLLPKPLSFVIVHFFESFWVILQPMIMAVSGDQLGLAFIHNNYKEDYKGIKDPAMWILFFIVVILYALISIFHQFYLSVSLTFRPMSLPVFNHNLETVILQMTSLVSFITSILPYCSKACKIIFYILTFLAYVTPFIFVPMCGNFLTGSHSSIFYAFSSTGIVVTLINAIFDITNKELNSVVFLFEGIILIIFIIIFSILKKKILLSSLMVLDRIADIPKSFDEEISNVFQALLYAGAGFSAGNPFVCNWTFMDMIIDRWPLVSITWMLYARFAACFTDENSKLLWIDDKFKRKVYPTESVQIFHAQIHYLVERRDASMSAQLKKKVSECQRLTSSCRSKMRLYWESVLQGNPFDMEATAFSAQNSNEVAQSKIMHFLTLFPNNQYLTQSFLQFLIGIKADPTELKKWTNNLNLLKSGQFITQDLAQQQSLYYFPYLNAVNAKKHSAGIQSAFIPDFTPTSQSEPQFMSPGLTMDGHTTSTTSTTSGTSTSTTANTTSNSSACNSINSINSPEGSERLQLLTSIRMSIYNLQIPAVRNAIITYTVFFLIFFGVAFPLALRLTQIQFDNHLDLMNMAYLSASLRTQMTLLTFFCIEYVTYFLGINPNVTKDSNLSGNSVSIDYSIAESILETVAAIENSLNSIRYLNVLQSQGKFIKIAYQNIFESVLEYTTCTTTLKNSTETGNLESEFKCENTLKSIESSIMSSKLFASTLVNCHSLEEVMDQTKDEQFPNLIGSSFQSTTYLTEVCLRVGEQISDEVTDMKKVALIVGIILAVVIFVCYLLAIILLSYKFNSDKRATAKCFLMVPKHVVSHVVDKFRYSSSIDTDAAASEANQMIEIQKNKQEENFLATLSSASSNRWTVYGSIILISVFEFIVMASAIIVSLYVYFSVNRFGDFDDLHSPVHNFFQLPVAKAILGINCVYLLAIIDNGNPIPRFNRTKFIEVGEEMAYQMQNYSSAVLYGSSSLELQSLLDLNRKYITDLFKSIEYGEIFDLISTINSTYEVMSPSSQFYLSKEFLSRTFVMAKEGNVSLSDPQNVNLWSMIYDNYYLNYIQPKSYDINQRTFIDFDKIRQSEIVLLAFLYLIAIIFYALSIIKVMSISSNIKWIISTMLQFAPEVLLNSDSVMRIISGSFKEAPFNIPQYSDSFYEKLTNDCEDGLLVTSTDTTIQWASKACEQIFNKPVSELVGKTFRQVLVGSSEANSMKLHDQSVDEFFTNLETALSGRKTLSFTQMVQYEDLQSKTSKELDDEGTENSNSNNSSGSKEPTASNSQQNQDENDDVSDHTKFLNIKLTAFSRNGVVKSLIQAKGKLTTLSFLCQDMTKYIKSSQSLAQHREKVDKMMTEIIPAQVLPYIHRDEEQISFIEQSASFVCLTIADFDLTVASISSSQTMSILSKVLSEFDSILNTTSKSVVKMRVFGDIYVAAGGFFSEVAIHPMTHAKECVKFGMDCISRIAEITQNLGISIKLRVGVNTGGPVIVGILKTKLASPTLNIIGSAFDVACEIMSGGEPMNVVITSSVYENIFSGSYSFRKGPDMMTSSSGLIHTYLINPFA